MSCQKCGSTDAYCGCDEETAIAERDAALAELAALRNLLASAVRRTVCMDGVSGYGYSVGEKVVILRASDIENCVTKREDDK